jgi:PAS domain S-box-containing protein
VLPIGLVLAAPSDDDDTLQMIIDAVPTWIAYIDGRQRYRLVNAAYRASIVAVLGDVRGRAMRDVLGAAAYELVRPHVETALAGTQVTFEARVPDAEGHERWIRAHYVPHVGGDGSVRGFVSEVQDITAHKRVEQRLSVLAEASRALATPIDHASTLHIVAQVAVPNLATCCAVFLERDGGYEPVAVEPAGDAVWTLARTLVPDDRWDHPLVRAMRTGEAVQIERSERGARTIALVPLIARGRSLGALMLGRSAPYEPDDIALLEELGRRAGSALDTAHLFEAERRINERLSEEITRREEADRKKDEFLALLGHELRNPLAPIVTALDLIDMAGPVGFERERSVIRRQADHLTRLVDDLLDVSRVMREKIQLRKEPIELARVVTQAVEIASPLLEQRRHELVIDVPREGARVNADAMRLGQVFANLLTNAAKYTEPGGKIAIHARREGGAIEVAVSDNGNGISKGLLAHIFDPFVQSDRTIDRAQGGLGLGLALVKSLTQLHGGKVSAHSDGPGKGSRFVVRLPAYAPGPSTDEAVTGRMAAVIPPSARVLVVDDNVDAADTLADVLRKVGYEVTVAHDAPTALHIAAEFKPAIALLDIGLPVMDGYELARRLRSSLPEPPRLIAVSGYGADADLARSRAAGFEVHLGKPVNFDTLVNALGTLHEQEGT